MQERFGPKTTGRKNRRCAGKTAHRKGGVGTACFEDFSRCAPGLPETAHEGEAAATLKGDRRKCVDLHSTRGFDSPLVHFLGRNEQPNLAAASGQLLRHRDSGKEMSARSAASNGDEGRSCADVRHAGCGSASR